MPGGDSHVEAEKRLPLFPVAHTFDVDGVKEAIRRVQKAETSYIEFMGQISAAGVTHYWVYLTGKKAVYVGAAGRCVDGIVSRRDDSDLRESPCEGKPHVSVANVGYPVL